MSLVPAQRRSYCFALVPPDPYTGKIMIRRDRLIEHLGRLVHLTRSIMMKRALTAVDPNPHLNFWRLIYGNQLDIAVIEWCKVFGSDGEATHWKKVVPTIYHVRFRNDLLASAGIAGGAWTSYWKEMKTYRDNLAVHHNSAIRIPEFPKLDIALKSSYFYYAHLIKEMRQLGETRFPDDLEAYCIEFELLAREVAASAIAATAIIEERVR
jgi:hypothetical protein